MKDNKIHLGLGFYIKTDNPQADIRTVTNANSQFWSILTILAINELHRRIDLANLQSDIIITSSIYDAIYFEVRQDPTIIKWLNDNVVEIMLRDFIENQIVHNEASLEIGTSWADLTEIPNNASLSEITSLMESSCNYSTV